LAAAVILLFALAFAIRVYNIQKPFVGLLPPREFRSAVIAHDLYLGIQPATPAWEREVSAASRATMWSLELPVLEGLAAVTYRVTGGEELWIPRLYAAIFWLVGGIFFWLTVRSLFGSVAAVVLLAYYLFVPLGVIASKSFQPDTMMMMFYLAFLWAYLRYDEQPTSGRLGSAAAACALALFVRPLVLFPILGIVAALTAYRLRQGERRPLGHLALLAAAAAVGLSQYVYGVFVARSMNDQVDLTFRPHLLFMREYYRGWVDAGLDAVQLVGVVGALAGLAFVTSPRLKWLLGGLWISYVAFGLVFTYHICTHNYYHLQLIPTLALSAGSLIAALVTHVRGLRGGSLRLFWLGGILGLLVLLAMWQVVQQGRRPPYLEDRAVAEEIGALVNHSTTTVYLSPFYGTQLEYYGRFSGVYWPRPTTYGIYDPDGTHDATVEERIAALPYAPDYFVITDMAELQAHHTDLIPYLQENCSLVAETSQYFIYNRCPGFAPPAGG
jgi:hypothetical protein